MKNISIVFGLLLGFGCSDAAEEVDQPDLDTTTDEVELGTAEQAISRAEVSVGTVGTRIFGIPKSGTGGFVQCDDGALGAGSSCKGNLLTLPGSFFVTPGSSDAENRRSKGLAS